VIALRSEAYEAGRIHAAALLEACAPFKADPVKVLIDTEDYPRIVRDLPMAEFIVGWFHCVEDMTGSSLREIWGHLSAGLESGKGKGKGQKQTGSKPNTSPQKQSKPLTAAQKKAAVWGNPPTDPPPGVRKPGMPHRLAEAIKADPRAKGFAVADAGNGIITLTPQRTPMPQEHKVPTPAKPPAAAPKAKPTRKPKKASTQTGLPL
jgi:hypothetical protein